MHCIINSVRILKSGLCAKINAHVPCQFMLPDNFTKKQFVPISLPSYIPGLSSKVVARSYQGLEVIICMCACVFVCKPYEQS